MSMQSLNEIDFFVNLNNFYLENIGSHINLIVCSDLTLLLFAARTAGRSTGSAGNKIVFFQLKANHMILIQPEHFHTTLKKASIKFAILSITAVLFLQTMFSTSS